MPNCENYFDAMIKWVTFNFYLFLLNLTCIYYSSNILHFFKGSSGTVSMSKKANMPYTSAFIQEIYRFRTLVPFGSPHIANAATEIDGWMIPKGSTVS